MIVAKFSLDHMRHIIQMPARYVKNCIENRRHIHFWIVCFQYDDKFHSDLRTGKWNEWIK
jgi:hypothetical protein